MQAAERGEVTDAGAGEDGRGDDAEQRIAALDARGKDGDAENGPRHRRHVKGRADDGAGGAGFENAAGVAGIERAEDLALADQRMADRGGDAKDGCSGGKGDRHWSDASISPIFRWMRFTAFKGRIMTLKRVMRPVSSKPIMSIPFIAIPSISDLNSTMTDLSPDHSPTNSELGFLSVATAAVRYLMVIAFPRWGVWTTGDSKTASSWIMTSSAVQSPETAIRCQASMMRRVCGVLIGRSPPLRRPPCPAGGAPGPWYFSPA